MSTVPATLPCFCPKNHNDGWASEPVYPKTFNRYWFFIAALLVFGTICPVIHAQTLPVDIATQETQRQQERERALREQNERTPDVRLTPTAPTEKPHLPESESPCFIIRKISFGLEASVFDWALAAADERGDAATGRCLGSAGINLVITRIQNAIVARGFVTTRVLAEPQDLNSGSLRLKVIPGRIRSIRFTDDSGARANAWNALPSKPGDLLNLRDIEQGLENFKHAPTAEADIQIVPTDAVGESDLVIAWKQAFPLRLTLSLDDSGARSTGKLQGGVTISGDNLFGLNDLFYANINHGVGNAKGKGTQGHTVHYSIPYGYWSLDLNNTTSNYHQTVAGASQNYQYSGSSLNNEVKVSRLIYRDAYNKTSVALRTYLNEYHNYIDDTEIEVQHRRVAGWGAEIRHRAFLADATLDLSLAWRKGTGAYGALPAPEEAFNEGTSRPEIATAESTLTLPFKVADYALRYTANWRAQWNRTPLVPQDRFSIGGRHTVRGFDGESTLMAERGWLVRHELAVALGASGQEFYTGLDHGKVGGQSADLLIGTRLIGAVFGLRGAYKGLNWDCFVGTPLRRPEGFQTAQVTTGFNLLFTY